MNDENVKQFPVAAPAATDAPDAPAVCERILNGCRGITLSTAIEGVHMALCELVRAASNGNNDAAQIQIIDNVLRYYEHFPEPVIRGLTVADTETGSTVQ